MPSSRALWFRGSIYFVSVSQSIICILWTTIGKKRINFTLAVVELWSRSRIHLAQGHKSHSTPTNDFFTIPLVIHSFLFSTVLLSGLILYFIGSKDKAGRKHLERIIASFPSLHSDAKLVPFSNLKQRLRKSLNVLFQ